jgi:hypothetical protein
MLLPCWIECKKIYNLKKLKLLIASIQDFNIFHAYTLSTWIDGQQYVNTACPASVTIVETLPVNSLKHIILVKTARVLLYEAQTILAS